MAFKAWLAITTLFVGVGLAACGGDDTTSTATTGSPSTTSSSAGSGGQGGVGGAAPACGDGAINDGEACDDGNASPGDGCSAACAVEDGYECANEPSACATICGDGLVVGAEACDDGNAADDDGCDAACAVQDGYACSGEPSACAPVCGDGLLAGAETCDDGNADAGDGCSDACAVEDGYECAGEPTVCATVCGDGLLVGDELCDDGNADPDDGCAPVCTIEIGWSCAGEPSVCSTGCGDGIIAGAEVCDDGNAVGTDGCGVSCVVEPGFDCIGEPSACAPICGDGIVTGGEPCDDGDVTGGDGCGSTCAVELGFACVGAPSVCSGICGDGLLRGAEQCDDSNTAGGDGCTASCAVQLGYACAGEPSVCATVCGDGILKGVEQCDDGNTADGDCCSAGCTIEPGCEVEPNSTGATANDLAVLAISEMIRGQVSPAQDHDFYMLTVPPGAVASFSAQTTDGWSTTCASYALDSEITLYNSALVPIVNNDDSGGSCSSVSVAVLAAGVYYIEVKASDSLPFLQFNYTLSADLIVCGDGDLEGTEECDDGNLTNGDGCASDCTLEPVCGDGLVDPPEVCDDGNLTNGDGCSSTCQIETQPEVEPNGTLAQADASPLQISNDIFIVGAINPVADVDLFRLQLATSSVVRFETFDGTLQNCNVITTTLRVLNSVGGLVSSDAVGSGILNCGALVLYLPAGTYYVEVTETGNNATIPSYGLQVAVQTDSGVETEPNDTQLTATSLGGTDVFRFGGHQIDADADYYAVTVPSGASIRAELIEGGAETCESNGIDSFMTLYDSAGVSLLTDDDDGRGYCSQIDGTGASGFKDAAAHNLAAGTYYIKITAYSTGAGAQFDYRLQLTIRAP